MPIENTLFSHLEPIEDKLEFVSDKGNRELVHVKIAHPMTKPFLDELNPKKRRGLESFSVLLDLEYNTLTSNILNAHEKKPFKKVYVEGYQGNNKIIDKIDNAYAGIYKSVKALMERWAELETTEHLGFSLLLDMFSRIYGGYFNAIKKFEEKKQIPISYMKKKLLGVSNPFLNKIEEFFDGLEYFDFHAARENWIGININKSLKEDERGILFLGSLHSHERIYNQLENTRYFVYKQFKEGDLDCLLKLSTPK